ncbi:MAG: hypothetical protein SGBAC_002225 [Bacillariaceae sp.]
MLICIWEIILYHHAAWIEYHYKTHLKPKYGQRLPPGAVLLDSAPLSQALTGKHWAQIWATYSLIDPAYADGSTFQFWIDVGNGHCFLIPSLLFSFAITFDADESSIFCFSGMVSPRTQGLMVCVFQYVMMQGTFLYYASYIYSKKWVGVSLGGKLFVTVANILWVIFPAIAIAAAYHAVHDNSWQVLRSTT